MVDFNKRLGSGSPNAKPMDPAEIYDRADRESDVGPLRPAQIAVLAAWFSERRSARDVIVKMHTGQGKTLIGLLILQSKLNEGIGPSLYICPNNYLVEQTVAQAKRFGIPCCTARGDLPHEFTDAEQILVTSVQKVFNGFTKFGLGPHSEAVGALVMDDCHSCIDAIQDAVKITIPYDHGAYQSLLALFESDLKDQGAGTCADIKNHEFDALLPVPYWSWIDHHQAVVDILAKHAKSDEIKFSWQVLKDSLEHCTCVVSGKSIEIAPHLPPVDQFGSYADAKHRVFMSATVTNDAFLVKGLGLDATSIQEPLVDQNEKWSGEKMILVPSLIDSSLGRDELIASFGKTKPKPYGVVAITPSFKRAEDWKKAGADCPTSEKLEAAIQKLKNGDYAATVAIVNRYDGIDLPDNMCRILVLDSSPQGITLLERWTELCRAGGEFTQTRIARTIEQGLGRSVRGEKDYSVIVIMGADLVKQIRSGKTRGYFSTQTQTQIQIGIEIAGYAKDDFSAGQTSDFILNDLISKCIRRDSGWKRFYEQRMDAIENRPAHPKALDMFVAERDAERVFQRGKPKEAADIIQAFLDSRQVDDADRGWYLQEMARYSYSIDRNHSNTLQVSAHRINRYLLKPKAGMVVEPITVLGQQRVDKMVDWISQFQTSDDLLLEIDAITTQLRFGTPADHFEEALDKLGTALGYATQRPDKEWREGPDNLWALRKGQYLLFECKNQVDQDRTTINKHETGQLNNSCAWFDEHYPDCNCHNVMIIWTRNLGSGAGFNKYVRIMTNTKLERLVKRAIAFFSAFKGGDLRDVSGASVQQNLKYHKLTTDDLLKEYDEAPKPVV